jgi:hypothetical protein
MERVRSSVFFKKLVEQMQELQILETLLANARRGRSSHLGQSAVKKDFAAVPGVNANSVDRGASDGMLLRVLPFCEVLCLGLGV